MLLDTTVIVDPEKPTDWHTTNDNRDAKLQLAIFFPNRFRLFSPDANIGKSGSPIKTRLAISQHM